MICNLGWETTGANRARVQETIGFSVTVFDFVRRTEEFSEEGLEKLTATQCSPTSKYGICFFTMRLTTEYRIRSLQGLYNAFKQSVGGAFVASLESALRILQYSCIMYQRTGYQILRVGVSRVVTNFQFIYSLCF